ncbi:hypothetical protein D3C80_1516920 [compost metagenome]
MHQHLTGLQGLAEHQSIPLRKADLRCFGLAGQLALTAGGVDRELLATEQLLGVIGQIYRGFLHDAEQDGGR